MFTINELIQAFDNNLYYAWEVLYSEILVDHCQINSNHVKTLITLYSKGVQKLTSFKENHANYFKHKINSLIGLKKVIQCLNIENQNLKQQKNHNKKQKINRKQKNQLKLQLKNIENNLMDRKKQIQMRVAFDMQENKLSKVSNLLKEEMKKQQKLRQIVNNCISSQQEKLKNKLLLRKKRLSFPMNLPNKEEFTLETSIISMAQSQDGFQADQSVLQDISFLNSVVSDHES